MGAVCCKPTSALTEVKEQSLLDDSKLQAYGTEVLIPAQSVSKGKGKGKNATAPKAPPQSKGKGKGLKTASNDHFRQDVSATSDAEASTKKPCPICQAEGHTARACPEKGKQKDSSQASIAAGMLVGLVRIYEDHGGDIDILAESCKCSAEKIRRDPPIGANDFARKLVSGRYNIPSSKGTSNGWSASSVAGGA